MRHVPSDRWATVVAALLDGVALVAATIPLHLRAGDARRLVARARERASVLVALGPWPVEAALRVHAEGSTWSGTGLLATRDHAGERRNAAVRRNEATRGRGMSTTRTCSVWCPDWPIVAARTRDPDLAGVPVVVRERIGSRELVRAASAEARADGVGRGMRRREAEARCPGVVVVDADLALEARTFESVARAVETITPRVVLDRPGRCALPDARAVALFRRRPRARVCGCATSWPSDDVRVGIADGEFAAGLAAAARVRRRAVGG